MAYIQTSEGNNNYDVITYLSDGNILLANSLTAAAIIVTPGGQFINNIDIVNPLICDSGCHWYIASEKSGFLYYGISVNGYPIWSYFKYVLSLYKLLV